MFTLSLYEQTQIDRDILTLQMELVSPVPMSTDVVADCHSRDGLAVVEPPGVVEPPAVVVPPEPGEILESNRTL